MAVVTVKKLSLVFRAAEIYSLYPKKFTDDFAAANEMRTLIVEAVPDKVNPALTSKHTPVLDRPSTTDVLSCAPSKTPANQSKTELLQDLLITTHFYLCSD